MERYGHLGGNYDPDDVSNSQNLSYTSFFASSNPFPPDIENKENSMQESNKFSIELTSKSSKTKKTNQVPNPSFISLTQ